MVAGRLPAATGAAQAGRLVAALADVRGVAREDEDCAVAEGAVASVAAYAAAKDADQMVSDAPGAAGSAPARGVKVRRYSVLQV